MQALHDVVKAGYARYIGMSSCYAYQCESIGRASSVIGTHALWLPVHQMQSQYLLVWEERQLSDSRLVVHRLRHHEQAHAVHLNAEPLQPSLPRRRTRDVPYTQSSLCPVTV